MKYLKLTGVLMALILMSMSTACSRVSPGPGEEAVLIEKPMFLGHGGINPEPVKTGSTYTAYTTDSVIVNMQPLRFDEPFEDLMSKDTQPMSFHAVVILRITDSVELVKRFGTNWYQNMIQKEFQNMVRDKAKDYTMTDLAVNQTSLTTLEGNVATALTTYLTSKHIPVEMQQVIVGRVSPPHNVVEQQKQTAENQQRIKTEAQRKLAEDARLAAEESRAAADRAYQEKMGLSPAQFVQLETMKLCVQAGKACQVFVGASPQPVVGR